MLFLGLISAVSETQENFEPVKKVINFILSFIGLFVVIFSSYEIFHNFHDFITLENIKEFFLPIVLTCLFIPFSYLFVLFAKYESLFVNVEHFLGGNKQLVSFTKRKILKLCHFNLDKLNRFFKKGAMLDQKSNKDDILKLIEDFKMEQSTEKQANETITK